MKVELPRTILGRTDLEITRFGIGGAYCESADGYRTALDCGVNYVDTARSYRDGEDEKVIGKAIQGRRHSLVIASKTAKRDAKGARRELETSLRELKTDYLDLWQIHSVTSTEDLEKIFAPGGAIEAFEAAKKAGKCRFIGFTGHHDPAAHLKMLELYDKYDTILMPLNPADPSYLSFERQVLPKAVARGMGIQGMKSTANAKLLQRFSAQKCINYVLSLPIHCLALGCTTLGQIEDDARTAQHHKQFTENEMALVRHGAQELAGPRLEDWKRDNLTASNGGRDWDYLGG